MCRGPLRIPLLRDRCREPEPRCHQVLGELPPLVEVVFERDHPARLQRIPARLKFDSYAFDIMHVADPLDQQSPLHWVVSRFELLIVDSAEDLTLTDHKTGNDATGPESLDFE